MFYWLLHKKVSLCDIDGDNCDTNSATSQRKKPIECDYVWVSEDYGKAEELLGEIDSNLSKDSIDRINAVAVGLDNTATNKGCRNSCMLRKNPNSLIAGCNWHLSQLLFQKGMMLTEEQ